MSFKSFAASTANIGKGKPNGKPKAAGSDAAAGGKSDSKSEAPATKS